mmetsp:Transcript_55055/g.98187  ORF Transcript_55055/g.98187 Transcript_55055/m.98187 type:complete len:508 (+) Transcript_55055:55-1578(+)|eukprot:CAMPEP_0197637542 /NCGR_PEP_ID=MMETSP1338-20131121/12735_1 /TAXON_ID=43686 ORGANISM="Pelagodinium beii, Strain RCC1491" /NCGR_SAMPLE_ID=MMETSP1338 /ASSEMBLY_ACC=CAM_ASM_000754 /LENGTH=507 /DNA_ID=CAMNT_0043209975 /DNA_START=55 /DNA_END=1578 /DNA_ORIENTATION=-
MPVPTAGAQKPATGLSGVEVYPEPRIKWHTNVDQHPSLLLEAGTRGLFTVPESRPSAVSTAAPASTRTSAGRGSDQEEFLIVRLTRCVGLEPPAAGLCGYRANAFYQSEGLEPREKRKTETKKGSPSSFGNGLDDCELAGIFKVPYNSREQFVKIGVFGTQADGSDLVVGEATVPIADPNAEIMNEWRVLRDFEERGQVILQVFLPGDDLGSVADLVTSASEAPTSQKPEEPSSDKSVDSMIPAPASDGVANAETNCLGYSLGDHVQVFSRTSKQWVLASVVSLDNSKSQLTVQYGERRITVELDAPNLSDYFRPLGDPYSPKTLSGFALGDPVKVFSKSQGAWLPGKVTRLDMLHQELTVEYGRTEKTVRLNADDFSSVIQKVDAQPDSDLPHPSLAAPLVPAVQAFAPAYTMTNPAMVMTAPGTSYAVSGAGYLATGQTAPYVSHPLRGYAQQMPQQMPLVAQTEDLFRIPATTATAPQELPYKVVKQPAQFVVTPSSAPTTYLR